MRLGTNVWVPKVNVPWVPYPDVVKDTAVSASATAAGAALAKPKASNAVKMEI